MVDHVIGVDIGLSGAIAVLDDTGMLITVEDIPVLADGTAKRRTINPILLASILFEHVPIRRAYVEFVAARPGEGPVGAFAFGRCRGIIEGVLGALNIPVVLPTPASWKRAAGLPVGTDKDASRSMAIARWPSRSELFKRKSDNGRSDAALIAVAGLKRSAT